jgi:hypothetical protein
MLANLQLLVHGMLAASSARLVSRTILVCIMNTLVAVIRCLLLLRVF